MKKLIYTSYSPNTRNKDLKLNISLLVKPWKLIHGEYPKLIENIFEDKFDNASKAYTFNLARSGMFVLFKSLDLPKDSQVLVLGFTCNAAVNPIKWASLKPVYVDMNASTGNMDTEILQKYLNKDVKAVLFQHTFGNSAGIEKITELCRTNNLILIEDCTHTIFGSHNDKLIGSFGDAAIFSLGRDKAVSGVDGGVILINNPRFIGSFDDNYNKISNPTTSWTYKELIYPLIWEVIKRTFTIGVGKLVHLSASKLNLIAKATSEQEKTGNMPKSIPAKLPNSLANLAYLQLKDVITLNKHRAELAEIYAKTLPQLQTFKFEDGNVPLRYPILVKNREKLIKFLKRENVFVGDWYTSPVTPLSISLEEYGYKKGSCPNSEAICEQIVNLPLHINTSKNDAQKVANLIKKYYANTN
jgi:dTDP-4-amino-4,6-dideoxygalactose transaminase